MTAQVSDKPFAYLHQRLRLMQDLKKLCMVEHHSPETLIKIGEFLSLPMVDEPMRVEIAKMISPDLNERKEVLAVIENQISKLSSAVLEQIQAQKAKPPHTQSSQPIEPGRITREVKIAVEDQEEDEVESAPEIPGSIKVEGRLPPLGDDHDISEAFDHTTSFDSSFDYELYQSTAQQLVDNPPKVIPLAGVENCEDYLYVNNEGEATYSIIRTDGDEFPDLSGKTIVGIRGVFVGIKGMQAPANQYSLVVSYEDCVPLEMDDGTPLKLCVRMGNGECTRLLDAHAVSNAGIAEFVAALNLLTRNYHFAINATIFWTNDRLVVASEPSIEVGRYRYVGTTQENREIHVDPIDSRDLTDLNYATSKLSIIGFLLDVLQ